MKIIALLIIISVTSCSIMRGDQNQRIKDNEDLAFQLSQFYGADQAIRQVSGK